MKKITFILIVYLISISAFGQNLKRKGFLGVYPVTLDQATAQTLGQPDLRGAVIKRVSEQSTADHASIKTNDIITSLNGKVITTAEELVTEAGKLRKGDQVEIKVYRDGKIIELSATALEREKETSPGIVEYLELPFDGGYSRTIVHYPNGEGPHPAIYYIQGYTCSSIEYNSDLSPFKKLMDEFVKNGFAVYKVEKPGIGDSMNDTPCDRIDFNQESDLFKKGLQQLKSLENIDSENIFIYGHSLGGTHAPIVATGESLKGVMVYGVGGESWYDYITRLILDQTPLYGYTYAQAETYLNEHREVLYEFFVKNKSPKEIIEKNAKAQEFFSMMLKYDGDEKLMGRHYKFFQTLDETNIAVNWSGVTCPVLAMYGGGDIEAISDYGAKKIVDIVNQLKPGHATYKFIPDTDHAMIKVGTRKEGMDLKISGQYPKVAQENFNSEYPQILIEWMKNLM